MEGAYLHMEGAYLHMEGAYCIWGLILGYNECIITSEFGSDGSCGDETVSESRWMVRTGTG